jgi:preprotein translocase SecE subunit
MDRPGGPPWRPPSPVAPHPTVAQFLRQCIAELGKSSWPTARAVRTNTTVLFVTVITLIVALGTLELTFGRLAGLWSS